jgi:hypothetical protein
MLSFVVIRFLFLKLNCLVSTAKHELERAITAAAQNALSIAIIIGMR